MRWTPTLSDGIDLAAALDLKTRSMSVSRPAARGHHLSLAPRRSGRQGRAAPGGAAGNGKKDTNPGGTPIEVFDGLTLGAPGQPRPAVHRYPAGPLDPIDPARRCRQWPDRQLVPPGYDGQRQGPLRITRWPSPRPILPTTSRKSTQPVLVIHSEDDQVVPYADLSCRPSR